MTAYQDGAGAWLFRLKSLHDGQERVVCDVQELLRVLEDWSARKEKHAQA